MAKKLSSFVAEESVNVEVIRGGTLLLCGMREGETLCMRGVVEVMVLSTSKRSLGLSVLGRRLPLGRPFQLRSHPWSSALCLEVADFGGPPHGQDAQDQGKSSAEVTDTSGSSGSLSSSSKTKTKAKKKRRSSPPASASSSSSSSSSPPRVSASSNKDLVAGDPSAAESADETAQALAARFPVVLRLRCIQGACEVSSDRCLVNVPGEYLSGKSHCLYLRGCEFVVPVDAARTSVAASKKKFAGVPCLTLSPAWRLAADTIVAAATTPMAAGQPVIAVCGPKGVGKTTFSRFLINRLLNHHGAVAYVETDIGQCEFTPPGVVALSFVTEPLFSEAHTHMACPPARAFFVGDATPRHCPSLYVEAVRLLLAGLRAEFGGTAGRSASESSDGGSSSSSSSSSSSNSNRGGAAGAGGGKASGKGGGKGGGSGAGGLPVPLIVNTCGWVKGMGYDLLNAVLYHAQPTHIVNLRSSYANKNFELVVPRPYDGEASSDGGSGSGISGGGGGGGSSSASASPASASAGGAQPQPQHHPHHQVAYDPQAGAAQVLELQAGSASGDDGGTRAPVSAFELRAMRLAEYFHFAPAAASVGPASTDGGGGRGGEGKGAESGPGAEAGADGGVAGDDESTSSAAAVSCSGAGGRPSRRCAALPSTTGVEWGDATPGYWQAGARGLRQQTPYRVSWSRVALAVLGGGVAVAPDQILRALNGAVVGLCAHPELGSLPVVRAPVVVAASGAARAASARKSAVVDAGDNTSGSGPEPPLVVDGRICDASGASAATALLSDCVGLGIIRSIDPSTGHLYIITPVPLERLRLVNLIVRGETSLPPSLLFDPSAVVTTPYATFSELSGRIGAGSAAMKGRGNVKRRRLERGGK